MGIVVKSSMNNRTTKILPTNLYNRTKRKEIIVMTFEERVEKSKAKLKEQMDENDKKIEQLYAQRDEKVEEIKEKRNDEISSVKTKCKEQVDALTAKNKELQAKWNDLEKKREEKHGKDIGSLFNEFVDKNIDAETVKVLFEEKGDELARLLNDLQGTAPEQTEDETSDSKEDADEFAEEEESTETYEA